MPYWKSLTCAAAVTLVASAPLSAQADSAFVAANGAACRAAPSLEAPVASRLMMGDVGEQLDTSSGWTQFTRPEGPCWISESLLLPYRTDQQSQALIDAARRMMERQPRPGAADFASLQRLVETQMEADGDNASPLLQLTRLRLLDAAGLPDREITDYAYQTEIMRYFESGGRWEVRREVYQALYERYRDDPAADELAWEYLRFAGSGECEDDPNCWLDRVERSYGLYWQQFPDGPYVAEALARGQRTLEIVEEYACWTGRDDYTVVSAERVSALERSVQALDAPEREDVLQILAAIRAKCG
jgi:hypothetical protein